MLSAQSILLDVRHWFNTHTDVASPLVQNVPIISGRCASSSCITGASSTWKPSCLNPSRRSFDCSLHKASIMSNFRGFEVAWNLCLTITVQMSLIVYALLVRAQMPKGDLDWDKLSRGMRVDFKRYQPECQGIIFRGLNHPGALYSYSFINSLITFESRLHFPRLVYI